MQISAQSHLTYCTNIHPGETWSDLERSLRTHVPSIKAELSSNAPFALGLRLSDRASQALQKDQAFDQLCELLRELDAYVLSINGFPYGTFHGTRIKQQVYSPDWRSQERVGYTRQLAQLLCRLSATGLTRSETLSISTVPGSYRYGEQSESDRVTIASNLARTALELAQLEETTGTRVTLGLEPEPACLLETTPETISFIEDEILARSARGRLGAPFSGTQAQWEEKIKAHLGLCLDTCHAAVQYEDPRESVQALRKSGLLVTKMQVTAGLQVRRASPAARARLEQFDDGQYLHQGTVKLESGLQRFVDLPHALGNPDWFDAPWRVHFHVPVFMESFGDYLESTQVDLMAILDEQKRAPFTEHIEVETYTFSVLPIQYRTGSVAEAIVRELAWTRDQLVS